MSPVLPTYVVDITCTRRFFCVGETLLYFMSTFHIQSRDIFPPFWINVDMSDMSWHVWRHMQLSIQTNLWCLPGCQLALFHLYTRFYHLLALFVFFTCHPHPPTGQPSASFCTYTCLFCRRVYPTALFDPTAGLRRPPLTRPLLSNPRAGGIPWVRRPHKWLPPHSAIVDGVGQECQEDGKIDTADLDSPCQEIFVHSLGFVVALTFFSEIVFCCVSDGGPLQL